MVMQEELAAIVYGTLAIDQLTIYVKARILKGEKVEPGVYAATVMEPENPDLDYVGITNCGLGIDIEQQKRQRRRAAKKTEKGIK